MGTFGIACWLSTSIVGYTRCCCTAPIHFPTSQQLANPSSGEPVDMDQESEVEGEIPYGDIPSSKVSVAAFVQQPSAVHNPVSVSGFSGSSLPPKPDSQATEPFVNLPSGVSGHAAAVPACLPVPPSAVVLPQLPHSVAQKPSTAEHTSNASANAAAETSLRTVMAPSKAQQPPALLLPSLVFSLSDQQPADLTSSGWMDTIEGRNTIRVALQEASLKSLNFLME